MAPTDVTTNPVNARKSPRRWTIVGLVLGIVALGVLAIVLQRHAALTWIGSLLVVEDELRPADVIVPLSGGSLDREIEAADLFRGGYAPRVVLTHEPEIPAAAYLASRGIHLSRGEDRRLQVLAALGVPRERVSVITKPVTSTLDEAQLVNTWAAQSGVRRIIIVSSYQHTARAKYIFERYAATSQITIIVRPAKLSEFRPDSWWTTRAMLREGIFELEKLIAYRLRY